VFDLQRHPAARHERCDPVTVHREFSPPHRVGERHRDRVDPFRSHELIEQRLPHGDDKLAPRDRLRQRQRQRDDIFERHTAHLRVVPRDAQRIGIVAIRQQDDPRREILVRPGRRA
jgi:hypothetical protein